MNADTVPYLLSVRVKPERVPSNDYPFNLPLVRTLEIDFNSPVTFFVGENGTGKSTVIEGPDQARHSAESGGVLETPATGRCKGCEASAIEELSWRETPGLTSSETTVELAPRSWLVRDGDRRYHLPRHVDASRRRGLIVTASTELVIGDAGAQHVLVRAESRHHPHLFDSSDANWISSEVTVVAGGMRAAFRAELRSEEFQTFLDEAEALNRALDGVATFSSMEGQLTVSLSVDSAGQVRVEGEAIDSPGSANRLHFAFVIDQSCLPQICRSLEVLLAAFPVVGAAEA